MNKSTLNEFIQLSGRTIKKATSNDYEVVIELEDGSTFTIVSVGFGCDGVETDYVEKANH